MFVWSKATSATDESAYWVLPVSPLMAEIITGRNHYWQKSSWIFFPLRKLRKRMSLLTENLWRMRIVKHSILIIQYKLSTLLFQQALSSPSRTIFCSVCICLKFWMDNGATDPTETFSIHLHLLHSWFNIQHIHSSAFFVLFWCWQSQDAEKRGKTEEHNCREWGVVWSRVACVKMQLWKHCGSWSSTTFIPIHVSQELRGDNLCEFAFSFN